MSPTLPNDNNPIDIDSQSQGSAHSITHTSMKVDFPQPILINCVNDFLELSKALADITGPNSFSCKSISSDLKLQLDTPDIYRKIFNFPKVNDAEYHTYQLKSDKAFRLMVRNLHPSTFVFEISA